MITYFITNGLYRTGGTEKMILQLASMFQDQGIVVIVPDSKNIAFNGFDNIKIISAEVGEFPIDGIFNKFYHRYKYAVWLKKYLQLNKANNVVSFSFDLNIVNILINFLSEVKVIICEHIEYGYHKGIRNYIRKFFYKFNSVKLVCLTDTDKNKFIMDGIDAITIPNFIFPTIADYNIDSKILLGIGRLEYQKNFEFLIKSFIFSNVYREGWCLHIYGEGSEKEDLQNLILKNNMQESIKIHNFTKDISFHYKQAAVLCMTSRFEAFPMVLLEAMNHSLPVLVTNFPTGAQEILGRDNPQIVNEYNEIVYAKELEKVCYDIELRKLYSSNNSDLIQQYYPETILNKWKELLEIS